MNRFEEKRDPFFKGERIIESFMHNHKDFDIMVNHWTPNYGDERARVLDILGHKANHWNIYIRFKPSFPEFDKLPNNYCNNLDNISFGVTFYHKDGENKVFGNDYLSDRKVMNSDNFDEHNRCFIDAHNILKQLEDICKGDKNGKN